MEELIDDKKENQSYKRDEYVYLSKLYQKAGRYEEMINFITWFVTLNPELNKPERTLFVDGFKLSAELKKQAWRNVFSAEKREIFKTTEINNASLIKEARVKIELEL